MPLPGRRPRADEFAGEAAVSVAQPIRSPRPGWHRRLALLAAAVVLTACSLEATTPSPNPSVATSTPPSASPSASRSASPTETAAPSPTDSGRLTLPAPTSSDPTPIRYAVTVEVEAGGSGRIVVVVTNLGQVIIPELVLRWPTGLRDTIFLAPFQPSQQRIREGGDPLVQDWTSWVEGPGEHDEPEGTTSLGWGPLLKGGTLTIPVLATRVAPGPIDFDLQILNGDTGAVLRADGEPAWFQVEVP
jgi:hypothetical protein